jgi:hypothetical protein
MPDGQQTPFVINCLLAFATAVALLMGSALAPSSARADRQATLARFFGASSLTPGGARPDPRRGCSDGLKHRTAEETIRQHLAFLQTGDLDQAMCDFDEDSKVILPGQVVSGLDNIRAGLSNIGALLGDAIPEVRTLTATKAVVLITFTALGEPCTIPDGSDTYVVEKGHIVTQTVHDTLHNAPGASCPVAAPGS